MPATPALFPLSEHKTFEFIAESTNITNTLNVTNLNTTAQVDSFGNAVVPPRIQRSPLSDQRLIQMGVRFTF